MLNPKLCIVIHAEEEFDWNKGFYRSNNQVTHGDELIEIIDKIIQLGAKITLAMDYPFVTSEQGKKVINCFKYHNDDIEFATHLHPWVNPPYETNEDKVENRFSFPGNLSKVDEFNKLKKLTEKIEQETGTRPITYLAGRYGIGKNSNEILKLLGYKIDLSISAYSNFTHVEGPNFIEFTNKINYKNGVTYIPHTCSMMAFSRMIEKYINRNPSKIAITQKNKTYPLLAKLLRLKKYRLSPEGFSFQHMKEMTLNQLEIGQEEFVLSFHSPSVKLAGTPYVCSCDELSSFKNALVEYVNWFNTLPNNVNVLPKSFRRE